MKRKEIISLVPFEYRGIDFRKQPLHYRVAKGEQGVLSVEPYKSEILPYWKFKDPQIAQESSKKILNLFYSYKKKEDFVGMDMARKYLQMGFTRARRYANHKSGKKYEGPVPNDKKGISGAHGRKTLPLSYDYIKAESAEIFKTAWFKVEADETYAMMKVLWKQMFG